MLIGMGQLDASPAQAAPYKHPFWHVALALTGLCGAIAGVVAYEQNSTEEDRVGRTRIAATEGVAVGALLSGALWTVTRSGLIASK